MIIDRLEKLSMYVVLNPLFADVIDFLRCHDLQTLEVGKYPIRDNKVFLNLQMAKGRSQDEAVLETHIEMIDIQIPISAEETFGYTPLSDLPNYEYNAEKDITKYGEIKADLYHSEAWRVCHLLPSGWSCSLYYISRRYKKGNF